MKMILQITRRLGNSHGSQFKLGTAAKNVEVEEGTIVGDGLFRRMVSRMKMGEEQRLYFPFLQMNHSTFWIQLYHFIPLPLIDL